MTSDFNCKASIYTEIMIIAYADDQILHTRQFPLLDQITSMA